MAGRVTLAPEVGIATTNTDFSKIDIIVGKNFVSTGINDNMDLLKESLMVFPNPAQDKVMIQFANKTAQIENIEIFDISGSLVKQFSKAEIDIDGSVDINNLQSGLYMIRVGTSDGKQFNNKLQKL
jgi:hypothetical protein